MKFFIHHTYFYKHSNLLKRRFFYGLLFSLITCCIPAITFSLEKDQLDKRFKKLSNELRCPTCQGLAVKDSQAGFSTSIKGKIRELMEKGSSVFGVRREIKNLNSFRIIGKAIKYEIAEQAKIIESGGAVKQSTMIWSEIENRTKVTREKEDAHDYRYFPEPDLAPLRISNAEIEKILEQMPELPDQLASRLKNSYDLNSDDVLFLVSDKNIANYYEDVLKEINEPILVLNWIKVNVMKVLNRDKMDILQFAISPVRLAELLALLIENKITKDNASKVFDVMLDSNKNALDIMNSLKLNASTNQDDLSSIINKTVDGFPDELRRLKNGEKKLIKFFMGQVMKETKGKYPPALIIDMLNKI